MRRFAGLCAAFLLSCAIPSSHAAEPPGLAVDVKLRHVGKDLWRVDYSFRQAVTAMRLAAVGDYRPRAWKVLTPGMQLQTQADFDTLAARGKPFRSASVEIKTFDGVELKQYAPFNRFTDGGTAVFLGHLQGDVLQGKQERTMQADIQLAGLPQENVIAPPPNRMVPGGDRGYAYFGPAQAVAAGAVKILIDPATPDWMRETLLDVGAKMSGYFTAAYQRPLKDELFIMVSVAGFQAQGFSVKGGAVMGHLSYRLEGNQLLGDHPKKREVLTQVVAHEMAHLWQFNIARGGTNGNEQWIHEGGAEAMSLDGLAQTGIWSAQAVDAYRAKQHGTCEKLGNSVDTYDGIYACGLMRFDQLGVAIVPLWRAMIQATESNGELYSQQMIDTIVAGR